MCVAVEFNNSVQARWLIEMDSSPFEGAAIPRQEYGLGTGDDVDFKSKSPVPVAPQR